MNKLHFKVGLFTAASLLLAEEILVACFANFPALAAYCRANPKPTLIVPACLFYDMRHVEDMICARALVEELEGRDAFPAALDEIHASGRVLDFMAFRPETGKRDMELVLKKGWKRWARCSGAMVRHCSVASWTG